MYTFGAVFADVRAREHPGEVQVARLLGMYDAGRIVDPKTARSQLLGGMTWACSIKRSRPALIPSFGRRARWGRSHPRRATKLALGAENGLPLRVSGGPKQKRQIGGWLGDKAVTRRDAASRLVCAAARCAGRHAAGDRLLRSC